MDESSNTGPIPESAGASPRPRDTHATRRPAASGASASDSAHPAMSLKGFLERNPLPWRGSQNAYDTARLPKNFSEWQRQKEARRQENAGTRAGQEDPSENRPLPRPRTQDASTSSARLPRNFSEWKRQKEARRQEKAGTRDRQQESSARAASGPGQDAFRGQANETMRVRRQDSVENGQPAVPGTSPDASDSNSRPLTEAERNNQFGAETDAARGERLRAEFFAKIQSSDDEWEDSESEGEDRSKQSGPQLQKPAQQHSTPPAADEQATSELKPKEQKRSKVQVQELQKPIQQKSIPRAADEQVKSDGTGHNQSMLEEAQLQKPVQQESMPQAANEQAKSDGYIQDQSNLQGLQVQQATQPESIPKAADEQVASDGLDQPKSTRGQREELPRTIRRNSLRRPLRQAAAIPPSIAISSRRLSSSDLAQSDLFFSSTEPFWNSARKAFGDKTAATFDLSFGFEEPQLTEFAEQKLQFEAIENTILDRSPADVDAATQTSPVA